MEKQSCKLVNLTNGHSKFYNMDYDGESEEFTVQYGKIGNSPNQTSYPIADWDKIKKSKLKKDYKEITNSVEV